MKLIKKINNLYKCNGFIEFYDISKSNSNQQQRIKLVTQIAKVCRDLNKIKDKQKLYQKLFIQHAGNPSQVIQFIPVKLFTDEKHKIIDQRFCYRKPGTLTLFTNLRNIKKQFYETCYNEIVDNYFLIKICVPQMIVPQILRHGALTFNQKSERLCKNRQYYHEQKLLQIFQNFYKNNYKDYNDWIYQISQQQLDFIQKEYGIRQEITNKGSHGLSMTKLFIGGYKNDSTCWQNYLDVRLENKTQKEHRILAEKINQEFVK